MGRNLKKALLASMFILLSMSIEITVYASKPRSYSLVVSGIPGTRNDEKNMVDVLQKNQLYSENVVYTFEYNTDAKWGLDGTTKIAYNNAIDTAYAKCTTNDVAYFFHSGHGSELGEDTNGLGIVLRLQGLSFYKYYDLLNKLSDVKCKHMVIFLQACKSGAVYDAYRKLPENKQKKISLFWSSGAKEYSWGNLESNASVYCEAANCQRS
jgi:hypothetical protein